MAETKTPIYVAFKNVMDSIPEELTQRMKILEDIGTTEALDLRDEIHALKKSFFYRRKKYRDDTNEKNISEYMSYVHMLVVKFVEIDNKIREDFE